MLFKLILCVIAGACKCPPWTPGVCSLNTGPRIPSSAPPHLSSTAWYWRSTMGGGARPSKSGSRQWLGRKWKGMRSTSRKLANTLGCERGRRGGG